MPSLPVQLQARCARTVRGPRNLCIRAVIYMIAGSLMCHIYATFYSGFGRAGVDRSVANSEASAALNARDRDHRPDSLFVAGDRWFEPISLQRRGRAKFGARREDRCTRGCGNADRSLVCAPQIGTPAPDAIAAVVIFIAFGPPRVVRRTAPIRRHNHRS